MPDLDGLPWLLIKAISDDAGNGVDRTTQEEAAARAASLLPKLLGVLHASGRIPTFREDAATASLTNAMIGREIRVSAGDVKTGSMNDYLNNVIGPRVRSSRRAISGSQGVVSIGSGTKPDIGSRNACLAIVPFIRTPSTKQDRQRTRFCAGRSVTSTYYYGNGPRAEPGLRAAAARESEKTVADIATQRARLCHMEFGRTDIAATLLRGEMRTLLRNMSQGERVAAITQNSHFREAAFEVPATLSGLSEDTRSELKRRIGLEEHPHEAAQLEDAEEAVAVANAAISMIAGALQTSGGFEGNNQAFENWMTTSSAGVEREIAAEKSRSDRQPTADGPFDDQLSSALRLNPYHAHARLNQRRWPSPT